MRGVAILILATVILPASIGFIGVMAFGLTGLQSVLLSWPAGAVVVVFGLVVGTGGGRGDQNVREDR